MIGDPYSYNDPTAPMPVPMTPSPDMYGANAPGVNPAPGAAGGGQVAPNYTLGPGMSNAFINAFYPGWGIQNGQLSAQNASAQNIADTPGAANRLNSLWDPYSQGNYEQFFKAYRGDAPSNPQSLADLLKPLEGLGWHGNPNAAGQITDFTLPNGQIVDPLIAHGTGGWAWQTGGGGGAAIDPSMTGNLIRDTFTPPAHVNLGGSPDLPFIPPAPQLNLPQFQAPPAFSYGDFKPPTAQDVYQEPGYQFGMDTGMRALRNQQSAQGNRLGGAAMKGLISFGEGYGTNFYGNAFNRLFQTYGANRANALDTYNTNYRTQYTDPYSFDTQAAKDMFAPKQSQWQTLGQAGQRADELNYDRAWDRYKFSKQWPYTVLSGQQNTGVNATVAAYS